MPNMFTPESWAVRRSRPRLDCSSGSALFLIGQLEESTWWRYSNVSKSIEHSESVNSGLYFVTLQHHQKVKWTLKYTKFNSFKRQKADEKIYVCKNFDNCFIQLIILRIQKTRWQTVWILMRWLIMSCLIRIKAVCKFNCLRHLKCCKTI